MSEHLNYKSKEYLKEIEKELNTLKEQSVINCEVVGQQDKQINKIDNNSEKINYNVKVSKWYLNLIDSTFSKIYEKMYKLPKLVRNSNILHKKEKNKVIEQINNIDNKKEELYDSIIQDLDEIGDIHRVIGAELSEQNKILDEINNTNECSKDILYSNTIKAKKIIRKL